MDNQKPLYKLREIASILRSENGCPWDREQTPLSLKPYLIEEAYEVYDAIDSQNSDDVKEELGDLLYQVYAHAQIASEKSDFDIDDVATGIADKLIRRHPHVFGDETLKDSAGVKQRWEEIKKGEKTKRKSILDGIPNHLPALVKAYRVQEKVSHVGFDWERIDDAMAKLDEEVAELKEVIELDDKERITDETGDVLFSIVNVLRFKGIDPEDALRKTIEKFRKRFAYVEEQSKDMGRSITDMDLAEMDALWEESKSRE